MWAKSYSAHQNNYQSNYFLLEYFNFIRIFLSNFVPLIFFFLVQNNIFLSIVAVKGLKQIRKMQFQLKRKKE